MAKTVNSRRLPFGLRREIPNAETIAAMQEAEEIANGRIVSKSYASFTDMLNDALAEAFDLSNR